MYVTFPNRFITSRPIVPPSLMGLTLDLVHWSSSLPVASSVSLLCALQMGPQGIPESWKSRTLRYPLLLQLATKVVSLREP